MRVVKAKRDVRITLQPARRSDDASVFCQPVSTFVSLANAADTVRGEASASETPPGQRKAPTFG